ncbi:MAG: Uncharacterized protein Athens071426_72 [Parcubacteria group bacterium Athens0714_26]|nr:MAG: Uncharacterized protein Athens071426_72 [Parcubacteria group bacterium Athens0714_26]
MLSKSLKFLIPLLVVIIGVSAYYIISKYNSNNLDLTLSAPDEAMIGIPFDLKMEFNNQSGDTLKDVSVTINLPDGMAFIGSKPDKIIESKNLGDIGQGSLISDNFKLVILKGDGESQKIKAVLNYSQSSTAARFETTKEKEILAKGSGISVQIAGPEKVFSGEEFILSVVYKNVSDMDFFDLGLTIDYPPSFSFISSTLKPDSGNNAWLLGSLKKGSDGNFTIKGTITGPDNSSFSFKPTLKTSLDGRVYDLSAGESSLGISSSPLSLAILLNDKNDYVSKPADTLNYVINYTNNTDVALRDVVIKARLMGAFFDFNNLETNATFSSGDGTLSWNSDNASELNFLPPHSSGFVKFKISTKGSYPITRLGDKNFTLKVNVGIESPTIPNFISAGKTSNMINLETKIAGNLTLDAKGYFRDAASGVLNSGPIPLRVGQPTNFTIHWILKNYAVDVANAQVKATLAGGVKFTGNSQSSFGSAPVYDESANQVVWSINSLSANKGVVDQLVEAIFQIEATPAAALAGKYMPLVSDAVVTATDSFTSLGLSASSGAIDTSLPNDSTMGAQGGVVQP